MKNIFQIAEGIKNLYNMKTLHRIYSILMFPIIATVYIATQILMLILNLMLSFKHDVFYGRPINPVLPDHYAAHYAYRLSYSIFYPFGIFINALQCLNEYSFWEIPTVIELEAKPNPMSGWTDRRKEPLPTQHCYIRIKPEYGDETYICQWKPRTKETTDHTPGLLGNAVTFDGSTFQAWEQNDLSHFFYYQKL
ncbi:hypothetical protein [Flavobacterium sp.]|uniref:hypothetical protein n=1 Tax=Flavobacterium sp. TaxID=239 RepID=UPI0040335739